MEVEDSLDTKQDGRPIPSTLLFDRLCSDDHRVNLRNSKDATVSMIVESLSPYIGRLVYGSLVYPERYHQSNLTTDMHHFLRQVFQRCNKRLGKDPQLKRVFYEEVKDGEGVHCHFFMEAPREMEMSKFIDLCEARWRKIASRNRRYAKQTERLKHAPQCSPLQPKTLLIKKEMPRIGRIASPIEIDSEVLAGNPKLDRLAQVRKVETLDDLTKYSLKWMTSTDPRFSSSLMTGGSELTIRGHCTQLILL